MQNQDTKESKTLVVLIHGFCKGADDMQYWKKHLAPEFSDVITPDLPTTFSSFERCLEKLTRSLSPDTAWAACSPENISNANAPEM